MMKEVCGCVTSGGTESILLSVKTHQEWGRAERGVECAEIVVPVTAHAAFEKACDILKVRLHKVPVDPLTFCVNTSVMATYCNANTVLIVGSAPSFPQGTIDPIAELSALALRVGCGLHVDCCLGGFVLPFAR